MRWLPSLITGAPGLFGFCYGLSDQYSAALWAGVLLLVVSAMAALTASRPEDNVEVKNMETLKRVKV